MALFKEVSSELSSRQFFNSHNTEHSDMMEVAQITRQRTRALHLPLYQLLIDRETDHTLEIQGKVELLPPLDKMQIMAVAR
jgi:hypothetical protein